MKRLFLISLVVILALPALQSCKKGENDPSISFKSRDARITATWKLTKIEGTTTTVSPSGSIVVTTTYDGAVRTKVTTMTGFPTFTATLNGTYEMTIEKNGKMSWTEIVSVSPPATDTYTGNGYWNWIDSDKEKSVVRLIGGNYLFTGGNCVIDRLATKELIIINETSSTDNGDSESETMKYTFEQQ